MSYDTKHRMNTAYLLIMLKQGERIESLVTYSARQAGLLKPKSKTSAIRRDERLLCDTTGNIMSKGD